MNEIRQSLAAALETRRDEIEEVLRTRVNTLGDTQGTQDAEYIEGLRLSIPKAFNFSLEVIAGSRGSAPAIPAVLLTQARLAARNGVGLATVQRRYVDCYHLLDEFLSEEAERQGLAAGVLKYIRQIAGELFGVLLDAVEEEYSREQTHLASPEQRRIQLIKDLLDGRLVDHRELAYDFGVFHLGMHARGTEAAKAIVGLARTLDCLPLIVRLDSRAVWAWLGKRQKPDTGRLDDLLSSHWPAATPLGVGEPAQGTKGWRQTFRQAAGAFGLALRSPKGIFRYANDPLLVTVAQDDLQVARLRECYLIPLAAEPDNGAKARETLRAYITSQRNISSAAAALGVNRQTVVNRLEKIEHRIERPLTGCLDEVGVALRLDELFGTSQR